MNTEKGTIKAALREQRKILQQAGLEKEWRKLQRRYKREQGASIFLYKDSCPEFYNGILYVAELVNWEDGLLNIVVKNSVDSVLRELEDYLNE